MKTRIWGLISIALLFLGVSLLAVPVRSDAVVINNVTVTRTLVDGGVGFNVISHTTFDAL